VTASADRPSPGVAGAIELTSGLESLPGVGRTRARQLAALGLTNVGKLIAHLPARHERHEPTRPIAQLEIGTAGAAVGEVTATRVAGRYPKQRLEARLADETGSIDLVWFGGAYLRERIQPGVRLAVRGVVRLFNHHPQMANPRFSVLSDNPAGAQGGGDSAGAEAGRRLVAVYPAGEGLRSVAVERAIASALPQALPLIEEHLPEDFRRHRGLPTLAEAYRMQHQPANEGEVASSRRRLAYDELLMLQLGVQLRRAAIRRAGLAVALRHDGAVHRRILSRLPHELTPGQHRVVGEVAQDLAGTTPANRLVQGDVGSGKTMVAAYAMLMAAASGKQAALMAPTEVLADQHERSLRAMLTRAEVRFGLLTGSTPGPERRALLDGLASGEVDIVVGTHALLTEGVDFHDLAVAIIDEQHRFGVHQRAALRDKVGHRGGIPHTLVMTATPIPRTIAISLLGDLDVSTIDDLPPGRTPVRTELVPTASRALAYERLRERVESGGRAFVVAPAIGGGDRQLTLEADDRPTAVGGPLTGVQELAEELAQGPLAGLRVGVLHGRMPRAAREAVMERFRAGEVSVLVATTIIEVGVDVPEATCMVVEQADRFGLAQLHQLRGRVGRGAGRARCMLVADPPTPEAHQRLEALCRTHSGFELADVDLSLRGPGELFGSRQTGAPPLRVADLTRDHELLELARRDAAGWIERSPQLQGEDMAVLRRRVLRTVGPWLGLADVG